MQPLQLVSIKLVISAISVLADLSAVGNLPHSLGPKQLREGLLLARI